MYKIIEDELLATYRELRNENPPEMLAVHKISPGKTQELVVPTVPFVGKHYAEQEKKILVYASAETLNDYYIGDSGEENDRIWLDDDSQAENRHRRCFEESVAAKSGFFPNVHISPMNEGVLATAVMYLAGLIRKENVKAPAQFYETIAFGNYSKYSIETEYQRKLRENHVLTDEDKETLSKINIDTAGNAILKFSHPFIQKDIEILKPDYIIMPNVGDKEFLKSFLPSNVKMIEIYQMTSRVINAGIIRKCRKYEKISPGDYNSLPDVIQEACKNVTGVNMEQFSYLFDYLEKVYSENGGDLRN